MTVGRLQAPGSVSETPFRFRVQWPSFAAEQFCCLLLACKSSGFKSLLFWGGVIAQPL